MRSSKHTAEGTFTDGERPRVTEGTKRTEDLAKRVRRALRDHADITEKRMFGGVCFLLRGNMLCGIARGELMFRVGKENEATALARSGARPMDFTGRKMTGFVFVDAESCDARGLKRWLTLAEGFVGELPAK